jgi:hypothetical protein
MQSKSFGIKFSIVFVLGLVLAEATGFIIGAGATGSGHTYKMIATTYSQYASADVNLFPNGADDNVVEVAIPFPIWAFGHKYTIAWVSSNGNVQLGTVGLTTPSGTLPSATLSSKAAIAPYWDDLVFAGPGQGVYNQTFFNDLNVGQSEWVVSWVGTEKATGDHVKFEAYFTSGSEQSFAFRYAEVGSGGTVGLQSSAVGPYVVLSQAPVAGQEVDFDFE